MGVDVARAAEMFGDVDIDFEIDIPVAGLDEVFGANAQRHLVARRDGRRDRQCQPRRRLAGDGDRHVPVAGFGDDVEIGFLVDDVRHAGTEQSMVVDQQYAGRSRWRHD